MVFLEEVCGHQVATMLEHIAQINEIRDLITGEDLRLISDSLRKINHKIKMKNVMTKEGQNDDELFTKEVIKSLAALNVLLDVFKTDPKYRSMYKATMRNLVEKCNILYNDDRNQTQKWVRQDRMTKLQNAVM